MQDINQSPAMESIKEQFAKVNNSETMKNIKEKSAPVVSYVGTVRLLAFSRRIGHVGQ